MKKGLGIAVVSILLLTFLAACGISQDKYDKVNSDLTAAQTQIQTLQGDLTAKNAELAAKDTELKATREKMGKAKGMIEVINGIFVPAIKGEFDNMTQTENLNYFLSWRDKVNAIGDATLTAKFQAIIDSEGDAETTLAFFVYLFESVPKTLE
jgi:outer membrane murein-binding lipoprotein Lpp